MRGLWAAILSITLLTASVLADGEWEITPDSEAAVDAGLRWLAANQGEAGNWESNDLGLVALGALAFLSAGHAPERGRYGANVARALDHLVNSARPSGLINVASEGRDMYNHGLAVFVLTQAYGVTGNSRLGRVLDKGLKLIVDVQCEDGGWDYIATRKSRGHDLSIAVMQAKALRGAMDIGLDIPPETVQMAINYVRDRYKPSGDQPDGRQYGTHPLASRPGSFTYNGSNASTAMASCGAVCLQEFGKYNDFRILRSMDKVCADIDSDMKKNKGTLPFDGYTMYYVAQGLYQIGGKRWQENYPKIRDAIVETQRESEKTNEAGSWEGGRVGGTQGKLFGTAVAVFALSIPNRYLPILQEGEVTAAEIANE
ncbi:MAG: hypothetical protein ACI8W8_001087 [Rhodothermales bacterium]|jgi:hypothetical protein